MPLPLSGTRWRQLEQFLKFGVVGSLGLVCDIASVYALRPLLGLDLATLAAYFIAATFNWVLNRLWTFHGLGLHHHPIMQWLRFLSANSLGFCLNRGTVYALFFFVPLCVHHPALALAAGALAGMLANFNISRAMVFRNHPGAPQTTPTQPDKKPHSTTP
ncbi:GtrA family protein [Acetobacter vaccinii]|uniref:GtrA family protein n=1 Tax=Acetobacter vaccinii TaxID=2592655 RepID=A0A5C1YMU5_9PROT|nr:GtrA family protein [Acetobacter vaccinii]QEO16549.1 GtrA family protein [Acetobacter vaccinii]